MKSWIAFLGGAALAGAVAVFVITRGSTESQTEQQAAQTAPQETARASTPAEPSTPAPAPAPILPARTPDPVRKPSPPAKTPAAPAVSESKTPTREPAVPVAQPDPATKPEAQKPAAQPTPAVSPRPAEPAKPAPPPEPRKVTIAAGTLIPVRLAESLSSDRNESGYQFQATLDQPLIVEGFVIAERGSRVEGRVVEAEKAGRVQGVSQIAVELVQLHTSDGQKVEIATETFQKEGEQSRKSDAAKVAGGAAVGAALGAIFGGGKGAAIGAGAGAGAGAGTVLATRGKAVTLPVETRISFRLKSPVTVVEKR